MVDGPITRDRGSKITDDSKRTPGKTERWPSARD